MALIKCPECKKKISDQCENCPNCGYPIKANITTVEAETFERFNLPKDNIAKSVFKKWWLWIVVGVVLAGFVLGTVLLVNRDTKPRLDKDGKPIFLEFTDEVYTNADEYKGYYINIKGKVFQVLGDNGTSKGIQVWLDPETCEQNLMIYYNTNVNVKQGDYISCSGYIDSVTKYKNAYDAELYAPLVYSTDLQKATYIDVMSPTTETITPDDLRKESSGYSVLVQKVEFSEKETRVYVSVANNGKATLYVGDSVIIQDGKQYKATTNYEANYDEIPYEIVKGASNAGVLVFPAIKTNDFELNLDLHSNDYDEKLGEYAFLIGKGSSKIKEPEKPIETITLENIRQEKYNYSISIDKIEFFEEETIIFLTATNNGKATLFVDIFDSVIVQNSKQYKPISEFVAAYDELPYKIARGASVSGVIAFPAMSTSDFEFTLDIHSDASNEELGDIIATIGKDKSEITNAWPKEPTPPPPPTYPSAVGTYSLYVEGWDCAVYSYIYIYSDGTLYNEYISDDKSVSVDTANRGTWTQRGDTICYNLYGVDGFVWNNPFYGTVYSDGIDFLGDYYKRIG